MNNPIRSAIHRHVEAAILEEFGGKVKGLNVLEVGCGRGVGTEIIFNRFGATRVTAIDLDEEMVAKARRRLSHIPREALDLRVGDVAKIDAPDGSFDAVFDFAILHHVPNWQEAVAEVRRVLKPGGKFFFEEVTRHALDKWSYRLFFDHPKENRFSASEFIAEVERNGMTVGDNHVEKYFGDFVFGVGLRNLEAAKG